MNKKIITLNARQYSIQGPAGYVLGPRDIQKAVQDILNGKVHTLNPATCKDVIQGTPQTINITVNPTMLGQPPYTYSLILDGIVKATAGPTTATSYSFTGVTFGEAVGAHTLVGQVIDSCATIQTAIDPCSSFNILAPPIVSSVSITGTITPIYPGQTLTLGASCLDQYGQPISCQTLVWQSSNNSIATVSNGIVTGVSPGSTNITVSSGSVVSAPVSVTVQAVPCNALGITMNIV